MTTVKIDFNVKEMLSSVGLVQGGKLQTAFNNELIRVSDPFVPYDLAAGANGGSLRNSAKIEPNNLGISYDTPYARRWWYEQANFQGAPIRGTRWVERAWAVNKDEIVAGLQNGMDRGLFNE